MLKPFSTFASQTALPSDPDNHCHLGKTWADPPPSVRSPWGKSQGRNKKGSVKSAQDGGWKASGFASVTCRWWEEPPHLETGYFQVSSGDGEHERRTPASRPASTQVPFSPVEHPERRQPCAGLINLMTWKKGQKNRGHNSSFVKVTGSRVQERQQALLLMAYIKFLFQATHDMEPFTNPLASPFVGEAVGGKKRKLNKTKKQGVSFVALSDFPWNPFTCWVQHQENNVFSRCVCVLALGGLCLFGANETGWQNWQWRSETSGWRQRRSRLGSVPNCSVPVDLQV